METDRTQIRQAVSDLDEEIKQLDLQKKRLTLIRRDLLLAIGDKKPVVRQVDFMTAPDGRKIDLSKYRFK